MTPHGGKLVKLVKLVTGQLWQDQLINISFKKNYKKTQTPHVMLEVRMVMGTIYKMLIS